SKRWGAALARQKKRTKFFFQNTREGTRVPSGGRVINVFPTPKWSGASPPATQAFFANYKLARPINGTIFTVGDLGGFGGLPSTLPAFGQTRFSVPTDQGAGSPQNSYQTVSRVDWNLSERTQIYGRYALDN